MSWSRKYKCCQKCGTVENKHEAKGLCIICYRKQTSSEEFVCEECGKAYTGWKYTKPKYNRRVCNSCAIKTCPGKPGGRHIREDVVSRYVDFIKKQGHSCRREDLQKMPSAVSDKVWTRLGLSVRELHEKAGYSSVVSSWPSREEVIEWTKQQILKADRYLTMQDVYEQGIPKYVYEHRDVRIGDINNSLGYYGVKGAPSEYSDRESLLKACVGYVKQQGSHVRIRTLLNDLHIDFYCSWERFKMDIDEIHRLAGLNKKFQSTLESRVYKVLLTFFNEKDIRTQRRFKDCVSQAGYRLRFDFYIKPFNILIEVDGPQHSGGYRSTKALECNDKIKDEYCKENNIPLLRIDYTEFGDAADDYKLIKNRLEQLGVIKLF